MSAQLQLETWTQDEYLEMEEKSEVRHDFVGGYTATLRTLVWFNFIAP